MRTKVISVVIYCLLPFMLLAQGPDSTTVAQFQPREKYPTQGEALKSLGYASMLNGAASSAASIGMGVAGLAAIRSFLKSQEQLPGSETGVNVVSLLLGMVLITWDAALTYYGVLGGVSGAMLGVPMVAAGQAIKNSDEYWNDVRFEGPSQKGITIILEGATYVNYIQGSATLGYHLNEKLFLGAGFAPCQKNNIFASNPDIIWPAYAQGRYSFSKGFFSPYVALSPGYDFGGKAFYGSADIGVRVRLNRNSASSLWTGVRGVSTGDYKRLSCVLGWSF